VKKAFKAGFNSGELIMTMMMKYMTMMMIMMMMMTTMTIICDM